MLIKIYNKLVRNKIHDIIKENCEIPIFEILLDKDYIK